MTTWITDQLGTAAFGAEDIPADAHVVDVRDLVDKGGNAPALVLDKIEEASTALDTGTRVVICCDYGISRSNSIAIGVLARLEEVSVDEAARRFIAATGEQRMNLAVLSVVRQTSATRARPQGPHAMVVTGGSGALGAHLVPRLRRLGEVHAPDRTDVDLVEGAVGLELLVNEVGASTLIHLANPRVYSTTGSMGPSLVMLKHALSVCARAGIRFVYLSSWEVYSGYRSARLVADERLPRFPAGSYGQAKALAEQLIEYERGEHDFPLTMLRSSPVYGSGDKPKFLQHFIGKALAGEEIMTHRYRNGLPHLDLLHVDDLVDAVVAAVAGEFDGALNLGSGVSVSTDAAARQIVEHVGSESVVRHREIDADAPNVVMDIARAQRALGWAPRVDFDEGLGRLIDEHRVAATRQERGS